MVPWRKIAQRQQSRGPLDQLSDEDITFLSKTLVGLRAPSISKLQKTNSSIITAVFDAVGKVGKHLSMALRAIPDAGSQPQPKLPSFAEFDIPSELKGRATLRALGRLPMPPEELANSFPKEVSGAANACRPYSPYCARFPQEFPWRMDKPSRRRAWEHEKSLQRRYGRRTRRRLG